MRLYGNWKVDDDTRVYVEGIFADVTDDDDTYLPRPIDRNFGDFLNAFVDCGLTNAARFASAGRNCSMVPSD